MRPIGQPGDSEQQQCANHGERERYREAAGFKLPQRRNQPRGRGGSGYSHYLALLESDATMPNLSTQA